MARNTHTIKGIQDFENVERKVSKWFRRNDYQAAVFKRGRCRIIIGSSTTQIYYSLKERRGYKTYYRPSYGSSLLVFEVKTDGNKVAFECYTPLLLFALLKIELTFKEKTPWITKYRKEGYHDMVAFKEFLGLQCNR